MILRQTDVEHFRKCRHFNPLSSCCCLARWAAATDFFYRCLRLSGFDEPKCRLFWKKSTPIMLSIIPKCRHFQKKSTPIVSSNPSKYRHFQKYVYIYNVFNRPKMWTFFKKVDIQRFWSAFFLIWRHCGRRRCSEDQIEKRQNLRNMIDRRVSKTKLADVNPQSAHQAPSDRINLQIIPQWRVVVFDFPQPGRLCIRRAPSHLFFQQ